MELMTFDKAAAFFGLSNRQTIDNWFYQGVLPENLKIHVGRRVFIDKDELIEFIKKINRPNTKLKVVRSA